MSLTTVTPSVTRRARSSAAHPARSRSAGASRPRLRVVRDGEVAPVALAPVGAAPASGVVRRSPHGASVSRGPAARSGVARSGVARGGAAPVRHEAPLRLTRRGRVVVKTGSALMATVALVGGVLLMGRTAEAGSVVAPVPATYRVVTPGETLWKIAGEVAPGADRRDTVSDIMELNALSSAEVFAGQRIAVPGR